MKKTIRSISCPSCVQTLIIDRSGSEPILVTLNGRPVDRALLIDFVRWNGEKGKLQLTIEPGEHSKHTSVGLNPEEEVVLVCPRCRKTMSEGTFARILVEYVEDVPGDEYVIIAINDIGATYRRSGGIGTGKFELVNTGKTFTNTEKYLQDQINKVFSRG